MAKTNIEWTDFSWNVARGCRKKNEDCKNCYMFRDSFDGTRYNPRMVVKTKSVFTLPLKIKETKSECWEGKPLVFTSSLTDWAIEEIDPYRNEMWDIIRRCPHLIFQLLTKRPERLPDVLPPDWGDGWDNVWIGTSTGSNKSTNFIELMLRVPSKTYFVSFEPLHEQIDCSSIREHFKKIHWAVIGGESGNATGKFNARACEIGWITGLAYELKQQGVAVFIKQTGTVIAKKESYKDRHGRDWNEWPDYLRIREFPKHLLNI